MVRPAAAVPLPDESVEERLRRMTPVAAPTEQRAEVNDLFEALKRNRTLPRDEYDLIDPHGRRTRIPGAVTDVLRLVAEVLARGDAITVVPVGKELTTQQVAGILNVSTQYVVRLLDERRIPSSKTGKHRRMRLDDVLRYKQQRDADRMAALARITELSEELDGSSE